MSHSNRCLQPKCGLAIRIKNEIVPTHACFIIHTPTPKTHFAVATLFVQPYNISCFINSLNAQRVCVSLPLVWSYKALSDFIRTYLQFFPLVLFTFVLLFAKHDISYALYTSSSNNKLQNSNLVGRTSNIALFAVLFFLFYFFKALDVIFWLIWNSSIWFWARRLHFTDCKLNFRITFPPHFGVQMIKNNCPKHVRSRKRMIITCKKSWRIKSTQGWNGFLFRFLNLLAIVIESIVVGSICINKMITKAHKLIEARLLLFNRYEIGLNLS